MMQRFLDQHEAITTTLCLMGKNEMYLNSEKMETVKRSITVLQPFEMATREMSPEKFTSLTKVILMIRGMQTCMKSSGDRERREMYVQCISPRG